MAADITPERVAELRRHVEDTQQVWVDTPTLAALLAAAEERDRLRAENEAMCRGYLAMERKVITCGVAATHPDAALTTSNPYYRDHDSPQAEAVRKLRAQRDALVAACELVFEDETNGLMSARSVRKLEETLAAIRAAKEATDGQ